MRTFAPLLPVLLLLIVIAAMAGNRERGTRAVASIVAVLVGVVVMALVLALIGRD